MDDSSKFIETLCQDQRWESARLPKLATISFTTVFDLCDLKTDNYEISVLGCDEKHIAELNRDFRNIDRPTNVLSWPQFDFVTLKADTPPETPLNPMLQNRVFLGDIAISFDTCYREATSEHKKFEDHVHHLLIHGCLHLLGYDHECDADASRMQDLETHALELLHIANPY